MSSISLTLSLRSRLLLGGSVDAYAVASFSPDLVFDFANEFYRTGGSTTDFDSAMTFSRAGNATMVDSDGVLKWAPHNLLTYSEQFDNAAWVKLDATITPAATTAPDGSSTASKLVLGVGTHGTSAYIQNFTTFSGTSRSVSIFAKAADAGYIALSDGNYSLVAGVNLSTGSVDYSISAEFTPTVTALPDGWFLITMTTTAATRLRIWSSTTIITSARTATGDGTSGIYIWGAHTYRSDLGGMADNPDTGNSYVPTTSSARYLSRRGHHVWNGSDWVNEGLLIESEARTNLVTYSNALTSTGWSSTNVTLAQDATGVDGQTSAWTLTTSSTGHLTQFSATVSEATVYTFSFYAKRGTMTDVKYSVFDVSNVANIIAPTSYYNQINSSGLTRVSVTFTTPAGCTSIRVYPLRDSGVTGTVVVSAAQLEAVSTPSSYIPTAGATVTRAAESLTVPYANLPWPTPNVIGPELVTNGTFDTDTSGWTATNSTLSTVDGNLRVAYTGTSPRAYQSVVCEVGKVYQLSVDAVAFNGDARFLVRVGNSEGNSDYYATGITAVSGTYTAIFVPSQTNVWITVYAVSANSVDDYSEYDNISVREIDPLAVSIQMDGAMTYADEGVTQNVLPVLWQDDFLNRIYWAINTSGTKTGEFDPTQVSGLTVHQAIGILGYFSGINVPFNIASRHGSIFINGAVDGVVLTANLTPTALPDLSATNLQLGYDFMGNIKKFRMWSDDIGDVGISEASS